MIKTVPYKGSKRKLLNSLLKIIKQYNPKTILDGFAGSGIVSAELRRNDYIVYGNDLNFSSKVYLMTFLKNYNTTDLFTEIEKMRLINGNSGWFSRTFSKSDNSVYAFSKHNAEKIQGYRDYIQGNILDEKKWPLIFSVLLAANKVLNNTNDQKSFFKNPLPSFFKDIEIEKPSIIVNHPEGIIYNEDIFNITKTDFDLCYFDPPYGNGVLYSSCYYINNLISLWKEPVFDYSYALPRPKEICFRKNKEVAGNFYSKKTIREDFEKIITKYDGILIFSYSNAPRNLISINELLDLMSQYGKTKLYDIDHKICAQYSSQNKIQSSLKEYFLVLER